MSCILKLLRGGYSGDNVGDYYRISGLGFGVLGGYRWGYVGDYERRIKGDARSFGL